MMQIERMEKKKNGNKSLFSFKKLTMNRIHAILVLLSLNLYGLAQRKCYSYEHFKQHQNKDVNLRNRIVESEKEIQSIHHSDDYLKRSVITIPVVVHVVYNSSLENISDAQINSQLEVLNEDYANLNTNALAPSHPFYSKTGSTGIQFCLATTDPNGNSTTGITRTKTNVVAWKEAEMDDMKFSAKGGIDNWNPKEYLNIYVVNFDPAIQLLGFATFPDELLSKPSYDGVVIQYQAFGRVGVAGSDGYDANALGRTTTHEVGHWLNMYHIWGDEECGDDLVSDTEKAESENYGCPSFPFRPNNKCGSGTNGEMYMNFMDYSDDGCMNMFTLGQGARMRSSISTLRKDLLTSKGCSNTSTALINSLSTFDNVNIFPNPINTDFTIQLQDVNFINSTIIIADMYGRILFKDVPKSNEILISSENFNNGIYLVTIKDDSFVWEKKIQIQK